VTAPGTQAAVKAPLPPYTGPGVRCPKCGVPCAAATQWHWAALAFTPRDQQDPACGELALLGIAVDGEHLCRRCGNCGYGWAEACTAGAGALAGRYRRAVPLPGVLVASLAVALACTGAGSFLGLAVGGAGLAAAWLAVAVAVSAAVTAGYAVLAGKGSRR
jgi:hypothetical protein